MAKHIHIHIPSSMTKDAGFDESKHKRDHGKFSTTTGTAEHHEAAASKHQSDNDRIGQNSDAVHRESARSSHIAAAHSLKQAEKAHAGGNPHLADVHKNKAEGYAQNAKKSEARLPKPAAKVREEPLDDDDPKATHKVDFVHKSGRSYATTHHGSASAAQRYANQEADPGKPFPVISAKK